MKSIQALIAVALIAVLAGGCGGGSAEPEAHEATGVGTVAADPAVPATDSGAQVAAPDACTLLSDAEAAAATGVQALAGVPSPPTDGYGSEALGSTECVWGDSSLRLTITPIDDLGLGPEFVASTGQAILSQRFGDAIPGLGDGAKLYLTTPAVMTVVSGRFQVDIRAYGSDTERMITAAEAVLERIPAS